MNGSLILLDTNIVSFVLKQHPLASAYERHLLGATHCISFVTEAELWAGAEKNGWGEARLQALQQALRQYKLLGYQPEISRTYATVVAARQRAGRPISFQDAWIAATALAHDLPLVTHDRRDFQGIAGLKLVSEAPPS